MGQTGSKVTPQTVAAAMPPVPPPPGDWIAFNPPILDMKNPSEGYTFKVKLCKPIKGKAFLFFSAPNIKFDKCHLEFNEQNFGQEQQLRLAGSPYLTPAEAERELKAAFVISAMNNPELHKKSAEYKMVRSKECGASCTAWGDPHYTPFDNAATYNFYGEGCFYYFKSQHLVVQANIGKRNPTDGVSFNRGLAVRYGKTHYVFCHKDGFRLASAPDTHGRNSGVEVIRGTNGNQHILKINDGTKIIVNQQGDAAFRYFDVTIEAPRHHAGKAAGMCGTVGAKGWTMGPNAPGQVIPKNDGQCDGMVKSWACSDIDLFTCHKNGGKCGYTNLACKTIAHTCKVPFIKDIPPPAYDDGYAVEGPGDGYAVETNAPPAYQNNENPAKVMVDKANPPNCPPDLKAKISAICKRAMFCPNAEKHVPSKQFMDDCLFDVCTMKNYQYVETSKEAYFQKMRDFMQSRVKDPACNVEMKLDFEKVQTGLGLGKADCLKGCTGRGECRVYGCRCNPGFTGKSCDIDYKAEKF